METLIIASALGILALVVGLMIMLIVANWKIYVKMGEAGWKCLIPIYGTYVRFKRIWNTKAAVLMLISNLVAAVFYIVQGSKMLSLMRTGNYDRIFTGGFILWSWVCIVGIWIALVLSVIVANKQAEAFGRNVGTALGLVLLPVIFVPILGFGSAQYQAQEEKVEALPEAEAE